MSFERQVSPSSIWVRYHEAQAAAFRLLFAEPPWPSSCRQILQKAIVVSKGIGDPKRSEIKKLLIEAIKLRESMLPHFQDPSVRLGHDFFKSTLKTIVKALSPTDVVQGKDSCIERLKEAGSSGAEQELNTSDTSVVDTSVINTSVNDPSYIDPDIENDKYMTFWAAVEASVDQLCDLWEQVLRKELDITAAAIVSTYLFREIKSNLNAANLLDPNWFLKIRKSSSPFRNPFQSAERAFLYVGSKIESYESRLINDIMLNARNLPKGCIPIVHDLLEAFGDVGEKITKPDGLLHTFTATVVSLLLLRLDRKWKPLLLSAKVEFTVLYNRLQKLSPHPKAEKVQRVVTSALDIITIGNLSCLVEGSMQNYLRLELGKPIVATVLHLYTYEKARNKEEHKVMDLLCENFANLAFWKGVPQNVKQCRQSMRKWVIGESSIATKIFSGRGTKAMSLLVRSLESPEETVIAISSIRELEWDRYLYTALGTLVLAIRSVCISKESEVSEEPEESEKSELDAAIRLTRFLFYNTDGTLASILDLLTKSLVNDEMFALLQERINDDKDRPEASENREKG